MACDVDEREPMRISFARAWSLSDYCIDTVCRVHVACIHMSGWLGPFGCMIGWSRFRLQGGVQ